MAYRHDAEGIHFHERGLFAQAAPLIEKAIAIDPDFAMAHARLAVVHHNRLAWEKRDYHAKRALDLTNRLTLREPYYIEGFYFSYSRKTLAKAIRRATRAQGG